MLGVHHAGSTRAGLSCAGGKRESRGSSRGEQREWKCTYGGGPGWGNLGVALEAQRIVMHGGDLLASGKKGKGVPFLEPHGGGGACRSRQRPGFG